MRFVSPRFRRDAQHNAALVEETSAALQQTEAQATELDRIADVFALDEKKPMRQVA